MRKTLFLLLFLGIVSCKNSENVKIVKEFYKAQNNYNKVKLEQLIHTDFKAKLWYGEIIQKKNITENTIINKSSNYSVKISKIKNKSKNSVSLIETPTNDFTEIMGLKKYKLLILLLDFKFIPIIHYICNADQYPFVFVYV